MKLFSTEQISKYHPDKFADQISDAILTECLSQDRDSHCGIETMVKDNTVVLGGEITTNAKVDYIDIVRRVASKLGYTVDAVIFFSEVTASLISWDCLPIRLITASTV